jgi:hypothetical protein
MKACRVVGDIAEIVHVDGSNSSLVTRPVSVSSLPVDIEPKAKTPSRRQVECWRSFFF